MDKRRRNRKSNWLAVPWWAVLAVIVAMGCSSGMEKNAVQNPANQIKGDWGVEAVALRLVGADHFIDFRYRIVDPDKAAVLLSRNNKPYLIDEASGKIHTVPLTKLGPIRASTVKPKANRNYVVIFGNTQKIIQKGSKVTVVIGDFRAEGLTVM